MNLRRSDLILKYYWFSFYITFRLEGYRLINTKWKTQNIMLWMKNILFYRETENFINSDNEGHKSTFKLDIFILFRDDSIKSKFYQMHRFIKFVFEFFIYRFNLYFTQRKFISNEFFSNEMLTIFFETSLKWIKFQTFWSMFKNALQLNDTLFCFGKSRLAVIHNNRIKQSIRDRESMYLH